MKCNYCGRTVRGDMPDHLKKNERCHKRHTESLRENLASVIAQQKNRQPREDDRYSDLYEE